MDQTTLDQFRKKLEEQKARLEKEIHEMAKEDVGDHVPGKHEVRMEDVGREEGENAVEVENYERELALEKQLDDQLSQIQAALERMDEGYYGKCAKCEMEIPLPRLEAYPAATTCVDCAKK